MKAAFSSYLLKNSEQVFALVILILAPVIDYLIPYKLVFLNSYFIIILLGTYYLETRTALMGGILSSLLITVYVYYFPEHFLEELSALDLWMNLLAWSSLLILTGAVVGRLVHRLKTRLGQLSRKVQVLEMENAYLDQRVTRLTNLPRS